MIQWWFQFFFRPVSALPFAVYRIVFGAYLFLYYIQINWFLRLHFADNGLFQNVTLHNGLPANTFSLLLAFPGQMQFAASVLYMLSLVSAFLFCVGFASRITAVLNWLFFVSWFSLISIGSNGGDGVISVVCFLFLLASLAGHPQRQLSVDAWLGRGKVVPHSPMIPAWSIRLFQLQVVLIYFYAGFHKVFSRVWYEATAMHYVFNQSAWSSIDLSFLSAHPLLIGVITYGSLLFELAIFPVLVWFAATRIYVLLSGVCFHVGIGMTMKVFVFCTIMPLNYLVFLRASDYHHVGQFAGKILARLTSATGEPDDRGKLQLLS